MKKLLTFSLTLLLLPLSLSAQKDSLSHNLSVGLNFLSHGEVCGGGLPRASQSDEDRSAFLMGRTRITLDFRQKGLQMRATLQNSAIWGMKGNQALNLYEGWARLSSRQGFFAQLGRVVLSYDDERIIGANDFAMASKSHDVLRLGYEGHGHRLHILGAYNQNGENVYSGTYYVGGAQPYKTMQTLWYHYDVPSFPLGASLLVMNMGLQAGDPGDDGNPDRVEYQQMYGLYLNFHPKTVSVEGSYYRQGGQTIDPLTMSSMPIQAWMASGKVSVKPSDCYGFVLGYDYLSGDDYVPVIYGGTLGLPRHSVHRGFSPLNGSRTKFYGLLDFFYQSAHINGFTPGLQNAFAGVSGKPLKALSCSLTYHYLAVATQLKELNSTLGHSIELQASYAFNPNVSLAVGYTQMIGTETMALLKQEGEGRQARWGWFSLVITPSLFSHKW